MNKTSSLTEMAKKFFLTGLGAIFMTEEAIRKAISELRLPRDLAGNLVDGVLQQKDDFIQAMAREVAQFLHHVKLHEEIQKVLDGMQLSVSADVSFKKSHSPRVRTKVVKKNAKKTSN